MTANQSPSGVYSTINSSTNQKAIACCCGSKEWAQILKLFCMLPVSEAAVGYFMARTITEQNPKPKIQNPNEFQNLVAAWYITEVE